MVLVLLFLILLFSLMAVAYGQLGSALRAEQARALQVQRDEGSVEATARALALLETGFPPASPYTCATTVSTSTGTSSFTVTFASLGNNTWSVQSSPTAPGENPRAMPGSFAP